MKRRLIKAIKGESGQALPIVLVLLLIGGLLIAPTLSYASTSLNAGQIVEKKVKGLYAADAGIEDALWKLKNDPPPFYPYPYPLPENVNQMPVAVDILEDERTYTLYFGDLIVVTEQHYDWLAVNGEMGEWEEEAEAYPYTITVTWQPYPGTPNINLEEVGVRLPVGYSYKAGSAAGFDGNLSSEEPNKNDVDPAGAHMLGWNWQHPPRPEIEPDNPVRTQSFYVTGEGSQDGDYTWVVGAHGQSIGQVGEVIGKLYRITATARPEGGEITVEADAIVFEGMGETTGEMRILLWQINPQ